MIFKFKVGDPVIITDEVQDERLRWKSGVIKGLLKGLHDPAYTIKLDHGELETCGMWEHKLIAADLCEGSVISDEDLMEVLG